METIILVLAVAILGSTVLQVLCVLLQFLLPAGSRVRRWFITGFVTMEKCAEFLPKWLWFCTLPVLVPIHWMLFESDSNDFWHGLLHWDWCSPNNAIASDVRGKRRLYS